MKNQLPETKNKRNNHFSKQNNLEKEDTFLENNKKSFFDEKNLNLKGYVDIYKTTKTSLNSSTKKANQTSQANQANQVKSIPSSQKKENDMINQSMSYKSFTPKTEYNFKEEYYQRLNTSQKKEKKTQTNKNHSETTNNSQNNNNNNKILDKSKVNDKDLITNPDFCFKSEFSKRQNSISILPSTRTDQKQKFTNMSNVHKTYKSIKGYLNKRHEESLEKLKLIERISKSRLDGECTFKPVISENSKVIIDQLSTNFNNSSVKSFGDRLFALKTQSFLEKTNKNQEKPSKFNDYKPVICSRSKEMNRQISDLFTWNERKNLKQEQLRKEKYEKQMEENKKVHTNKNSEEIFKKRTILTENINENTNENEENEEKVEEINKTYDISNENNSFSNEKERKNQKNQKNELETRTERLNEYYNKKNHQNQINEYHNIKNKRIELEEKPESIRDRISKAVEDRIKTNENSKFIDNKSNFINFTYKNMIEERRRLGKIDENHKKSGLESGYIELNYEYPLKDSDYNEYNDRDSLYKTCISSVFPHNSNIINKTLDVLNQINTDKSHGKYLYSHENLNKNKAFPCEYDIEVSSLEERNKKLNYLLKSNEIAEKELYNRLGSYSYRQE